MLIDTLTMSAAGPIKATLTERVVFTLVRSPVVRANAALGRYADEVIWLLGHPRSGTTWVAELINHDKRLRDMFEPIRPRRIERAAVVEQNEYVRPGSDFAELRELMEDVFTGRFAHPLVDFANRRPLYRGLIVKDVFANLFARWATEEFPQVRPVLLVRNPFAACLSLRKRHPENWPYDPAELVAQDELVADHLSPYADVLARVAAEGSDLEKSLATWAVMNLVPLRQFPESDLHVCFYEEFYADPQRRLTALLEFTGGGRARPRLSRRQADRPSRTAKGGNVVQNRSPLTTWRAECPPDEIERGVALLDALGVGALYGDRTEPDRAALASVRG